MPKSFVALLLLAAGCGKPSLVPGTGFVNVAGGRIWYEVSGTGSGVPLVAIHGGPGFMSCYHAPFKALGDDRKVILYDQLGSGNSDHPNDSTLWNVPRFLDELDSLRKALGLTKVNLLGHSWGGAIVGAYLTQRHPEGINSVVLAGPLLSTPVWLRDANILRKDLPAALQKVLAHHESLGTTSSKEYLAATDSFYSRFLFHVKFPPVEPPECKGLTVNMDVYKQMWGPSEFYSTGSLLSFDVSSGLGGIKAPVLLIGGEFDEARPETMREWQRQIPGARLEIIKNAGHMAMDDQPESYVSVLRAYLREMDKK